MCVAIALALSELPLTLAEGDGLADRPHKRGGEEEVRFYWRARPPLLPVWWNGRLQALRWGVRSQREKVRPPTGWTWRETVEEGKWAAMEPNPVPVSASYGLMNGVRR